MDMGGTSFDVCVIKDGEIPTTTESWVGEHRVAIKMVDVPTVGAGGGSLAWIDSLGLLRVGPQSAGADPGPAAYGKGEEAAVTDADLVLGYIPADYFLGGDIKLDAAALPPGGGARRRKLNMDDDQTAQAMFTTINTVMANLITEVCTKKGHDVRDFTLVAGGGAGGIHAGSDRQAIVHSDGDRAAGGGADERVRHVRHGPRSRICALLCAHGRTSWISPKSAACTPTCASRRGTISPASAFRERNCRSSRRVEMRYAGQFHEVEIELPAGELNAETLQVLLQNFHAKYEKMYTYSMPWRAAEFLTFRLKVTAPPPPAADGHQREAVNNVEIGAPRFAPLPVRRQFATRGNAGLRLGPDAPGHQLSGPALIDDKTTTVLVVPGFTCEVDPYRNLVLRAQQVAAVDGHSESENLKPAVQREFV